MLVLAEWLLHHGEQVQAIVKNTYIILQYVMAYAIGSCYGTQLYCSIPTRMIRLLCLVLAE